jgi:hypothetical protein
MSNKGKPGRPKNPPKAKEMLKGIIPIKDLFNEDELPIYESLIDVYLNDFDEDDLTAGDMDDIMSLAMNRVLEIRLLKSSRDEPEKHLDVSSSIEKLRKENQKLKENLSSRRRDRINPNEFKGFSIVDLAVAFDENQREKLRLKENKLRDEEENILAKRKSYMGNRFDNDAKPDSGEEED